MKLSSSLSSDSVAGGTFITISLVLLLVLAKGPAGTEGAIACSDVMNDLRPCVNYLANGKGAPPAECCAGASALASAASTTADKRAACACIKSASQKINANPKLAQALPASCGISLPFNVSSNVDCSEIN